MVLGSDFFLLLALRNAESAVCWVEGLWFSQFRERQQPKRPVHHGLCAEASCGRVSGSPKRD